MYLCVVCVGAADDNALSYCCHAYLNGMGTVITLSDWCQCQNVDRVTYEHISSKLNQYIIPLPWSSAVSLPQAASTKEKLCVFYVKTYPSFFPLKRAQKKLASSKSYMKCGSFHSHIWVPAILGQGAKYLGWGMLSLYIILLSLCANARR